MAKKKKTSAKRKPVKRKKISNAKLPKKKPAVVRPKRVKPIKKVTKRKPLRKSKSKLVRTGKKVLPTRKPTRKNNKTSKGSVKVRRVTKPRISKPQTNVKGKITFDNENDRPIAFVKIPLGRLSFQKKVQKINGLKSKLLTKYIRANKNKKGKGYKPPRAVAVIFKIKRPKSKDKFDKSQDKHFYNSVISPPDFVVNEDSVKKFVAEKLTEYNNKWVDYLMGPENTGGSKKVYNVSEVSIRFLY